MWRTARTTKSTSIHHLNADGTPSYLKIGAQCDEGRDDIETDGVVDSGSWRDDDSILLDIKRRNQQPQRPNIHILILITIATLLVASFFYWRGILIGWIPATTPSKYNANVSSNEQLNVSKELLLLLERHNYNDTKSDLQEQQQQLTAISQQQLAPLKESLPIYLVQSSTNETAQTTWGALARQWNRTTQYDDLFLNNAMSIPSLPQSFGNTTRRTVVMMHCSPKTGSTTLRAACIHNLETTCGMHHPTLKSMGYKDESKLFPLIKHHFCSKCITMLHTHVSVITTNGQPAR